MGKQGACARTASLHERILLALGWTWDAPCRHHERQPPPLVEVVEFGRNRAANRLPRGGAWHTVDARQSLALPWWRQILDDRFVTLLVVRDPVTVANRLAIRYGIPPSVGMALWNAYHRHVAGAIAGQSLVVVDHSTLLRDPYRTTRSMLDGLFDLGVDGHLDYATGAAALGLRRQHGAVPADEAGHGALAAGAMRTYARLTQHAVAAEHASSFMIPPPTDLERSLIDGWRALSVPRARAAAALARAEEELSITETRVRSAEARAHSAEATLQRLARDEIRVRRARDYLASYVSQTSRTLPGRLAHRWAQFRGGHVRSIRRLDALSRAFRSVITLRRPRGVRVHPLFDASWYDKAYPDVAAGRLDSWRHYRRHGAREGRRPNEWFDVRWYLEGNPDVPRDPMAALDHYLLDGAWRVATLVRSFGASGISATTRTSLPQA